MHSSGWHVSFIFIFSTILENPLIKNLNKSTNGPLMSPMELFFFDNKHLQTHIDSVNQECNSTSMCTTKDGCFAIVLNNVLCLDIKNFGNFLKYFIIPNLIFIFYRQLESVIIKSTKKNYILFLEKNNISVSKATTSIETT